ncbi:hypothetical protein J6590_101537 [Homalodisca vitripennis]|nr:hypothetical protein J6590_101537 [Homalodisca vitripennis]
MAPTGMPSRDDARAAVPRCLKRFQIPPRWLDIDRQSGLAPGTAYCAPIGRHWLAPLRLHVTVTPELSFSVARLGSKSVLAGK